MGVLDLNDSGSESIRSASMACEEEEEEIEEEVSGLD